MSTTSIVDRPTFRGITKDMLTKIFTDKRLVKMVHPLSVTLNRADCDNSARMLREIDYTLVFRYRATIDQYLLYNDPSTEDMIKDQAVKELNNALYGDIREDINKVINDLFNNHDTYEAAKALRKIVDKIMV